MCPDLHGFAACSWPRPCISAPQNPQGRLRYPPGASFAALSPYLGHPRAASPHTTSRAHVQVICTMLSTRCGLWLLHAHGQSEQTPPSGANSHATRRQYTLKAACAFVTPVLMEANEKALLIRGRCVGKLLCRFGRNSCNVNEAASSRCMLSISREREGRRQGGRARAKDAMRSLPVSMSPHRNLAE